MSDDEQDELDVFQLQCGTTVFAGEEAGETIDADPQAVVNVTDHQ